MGDNYFPLIFSIITFYPNIYRDKNSVIKKGGKQAKQGDMFLGFCYFGSFFGVLFIQQCSWSP